jgi:hypothetical protein
MPQTYKILGQAYPNSNTLSNVYVTGASTSAVVNTIYITNGTSQPANTEIILRPVNVALANRHRILRNETIPAASTYVLNLGITMGPNMILAANTIGTGGFGIRFSYNAFGLEIT